MSLELRDRFFALSTGDAPAGEVAEYRARVDATDAEPAATVDGLAVSWHPTARFKQVRFVDAERIDGEARDLFARPIEAMPDLAAVFADPRELSFRTFENILPLDRLFSDVPLDLELTGCGEFAKDAYTLSLRLRRPPGRGWRASMSWTSTSRRSTPHPEAVNASSSIRGCSPRRSPKRCARPCLTRCSTVSRT